MNLENVLVYPITRYNGLIIEALIKQSSNKNYILSTFSGSGLKDKNLVDVYKNEKCTNVTITEFKTDMLEATDKVIVLECGKKYNYSEVYDDFYQVLHTYNVDIQFDYHKKFIDGSNLIGKGKYYTYQNINLPVICISSLFPILDRVKLSYLIKQEFEKKGYKALVYSMNPNSELVGIKNYPVNLKKISMQISEIPLVLNSCFIEDIEKYNPDIILLDLPDGIVKVNEMILNDFGVYSNLVLNSIVPDYLIYFIPTNFYQEEYIEMYCEEIKRKIGITPNIVLESNILIDISDIFSLENDISFIYDGYSQSAINNNENIMKVKGNYENYISQIFQQILMFFEQ